LPNAISLLQLTLHQGHKYFECEMKRGVLVDPRATQLAAPKPAQVLLNPIYDSVVLVAPSAAFKPNSEYLSMEVDD
jgi:hypothetical protein